jgi:hypothetical protein
MNQVLNKLGKYEGFCFLTVVLLNLIPVFSHHFFPTLDGPAHLYNANLINHMLVHTDFESFFRFNSEPVPNWTGHILLCFFKWFLPGYLAEKMLLITYFVGISYAFRRLVKSFNPEYIILSYLIFPFTYNALLSFGFYNFSLGIIGLFLILSFWIRNHQTIAGSFKKIGILAVLFILTYFSHIVTFGVALLACGFYLLIFFLRELFQKRRIKDVFIGELKKGVALLLSSIIPLILLIIYFANKPNTGVKIFLPKEELIKWLNYLNPIICYHEGIESWFTRKIIYILYALIAGGIIIRVRNGLSRNKTTGKRGVFHFNDLWLLVAGIMLFLLFVMPDNNGSASVISIRFGLLFFLFLVIWISSMKPAKWFTLVCSILLLLIHFKRIRYYDSVIDQYDATAINCAKVSSFIEPNSIVASLNFTYWYQGHFSNYLGIDKPMVLLENYEATMDYFPLLWNTQKLPNFQIGGEPITENPLFSLTPTNTQNAKREVDYLFVLGKWDSTKTEHLQNLQLISHHFKLVHKNEHCLLYQRKSGRGIKSF